jgi:hypothetical protein
MPRNSCRIILAERRPHEIMILAIHLRAPTFSSINVATSLEQKRSEEEYSSRISINVAEIPRSLFIVSAAKTGIGSVTTLQSRAG